MLGRKAHALEWRLHFGATALYLPFLYPVRNSGTAKRRNGGREGLDCRTPNTPTNGRWGMNRGRGCGMPTTTAPLAAWVIPCLWPKKGTHSREQEVDGEGRAGGSSERGGQEIDYRGNHLYSSGAVAKRPNFPAKTTEYHLKKGQRKYSILKRVTSGKRAG